jgi:hypothetical protein
VLMLFICAPAYHHWQLQHFSGSSLRRNLEHFLASIIYLCTFSSFRRPRQSTHHIRHHNNRVDRILERLSLYCRASSRGCNWRRIGTGLFWRRSHKTVCGIYYKYRRPKLNDSRYGGGGCYYEQAAISDGQIFLIEAMSSFIML